jgi:hypothetical protein
MAGYMLRALHNLERNLADSVLLVNTQIQD